MSAVGDHLSSVVTQSGSGMNAEEENQGCIAKKWVNCRGGLQILAVNFWHTEGWTLKK